jgi:hypothetical protein
MNRLLVSLVIGLLILNFFRYIKADDSTGTITGKLYDENTGQALLGANLMLLGTKIGACTGINGTYKILGIPPGKYLLEVRLIAYTDLITDTIQIGAGSSIHKDIYLSTEDISKIICEQVAKRDSAGTGILEGRVFDSDSQWPGYSTTISLQGTQLGVMSDINGNYRIENLPQGIYTIKASSMGYYQRIIDSVLIEPLKLSKCDILMVKRNFAIAIDPIMPLTGGIAGIVYEGYTGSPIADATIILDDNKVISSSDFTSGNYYYDQIPPGIHSFTVTRHGYKKWHLMDIDIKRNRLFNQDIVLFPEILNEFAVNYPGKVTKLEGTIRDLEKRRGIKGVTIYVEGPNTRTQILNPKNPYDDKYSINWIPPGAYTVKVYLNGFRPQETNNVIINKGKTTKCDFNLIPDSDK